jgi:hypothetical protein
LSGFAPRTCILLVMARANSLSLRPRLQEVTESGNQITPPCSNSSRRHHYFWIGLTHHEEPNVPSHLRELSIEIFGFITRIPWMTYKHRLCGTLRKVKSIRSVSFAERDNALRALIRVVLVR